MSLGPGSRCVHGAQRPAATAPLVAPLIQSTTTAWKSIDEPPPVTYARGGNENTQRLEQRLTALEEGGGTVCFSSGLAAIDTLLRTLSPGERVVAGRHLYGGTLRLLSRFHGQLRVDIVDSSDAGALKQAAEEPAALFFVETPSNPTLRITDLRRAAAYAQACGARLAVDNTFLTPLYQRPLELGADVVVHSTTKYIDGHGATLGGALVFAPAHAGPGHDAHGSWEARTRWARKATGNILAPFEAWLTLQGCKTLHLRTRQQWSNAARLATLAQRHPAVEKVHYPALPTHPGHAIHRGQASGDGAIVSLDLGSLGRARAFANALRLFAIAENLGPTESILTHPATMTHADLLPAQRRANGIDDGLVRLSVGVEDPYDLEADVGQALDAAVELQAVTP